MSAKSANDTLPIFVDLDGTLIKSDVSYESFLALIKQNPLNFFKAIAWFIKGKPYLKAKIAESVELDAKHVPFNVEFVKYLRNEKEKGRKIILASASEKKFVENIAAESGLFDAVIATDKGLNLSGKNKTKAIKDYCETHNLNSGFAYAGNSSVDIPVWKVANERILVTDDKFFAGKVSKKMHFEKKFIFGRPLKSLILSLRPHQWSKNLLIFVPMFMAHKLFEPQILLATGYAFIAFCCAASSIYLINDLLDIEADRIHRTKMKRPLASGAMQVRTALIVIPVLLAVAAGISLNLPRNFSLCLCLYIFSTVLYSFFLKKIPVLDIIVLAMLYVLRLFAGSMSGGVFVSQWLLSFSLFAFTSLACLKRFSELALVKSEHLEKSLGRGYKVGDLEPISQFGTASAYLSVFVLVFYINSKEVAALYKNAGVLWLLCPVVLYWITRVWILAYRGKVHDDPVVFALRDKVSYLIVAIATAILMLAI
jgi:4-hydroxybenzoate polyprenyltransferase